MRRIALFALVASAWGQTGSAPASEPDESLAQLAKVRRVYVDLLTGGASALKIRDLLMASLQSARLFVITENQEKADAILKGSAEDTAFKESFYASEGLNAHTQVSLPGESSTSTRSSRTSAGLSIGENDSVRTEERKHEAMATVRLVSKD